MYNKLNKKRFRFNFILREKRIPDFFGKCFSRVYKESFSNAGAFEMVRYSWCLLLSE